MCAITKETATYTCCSVCELSPALEQNLGTGYRPAVIRKGKKSVWSLRRKHKSVSICLKKYIYVVLPAWHKNILAEVSCSRVLESYQCRNIISGHVVA